MKALYPRSNYRSEGQISNSLNLTMAFGCSACCASVVFKVDTLRNETVLHSFTCGPAQRAPWGANPMRV